MRAYVEHVFDWGSVPRVSIPVEDHHVLELRRGVSACGLVCAVDTSAAEVEELDLRDRAVEKVAAEAGEFFDGVGCVALKGGRVVGLVGEASVGAGYGGGSSMGRVDDLGFGAELAEGFGDERGDEGVVSAAEDDDCGVADGEGFGEVDAEDFASDGVIDPAFFNQRDEEGAGLFGGVEAMEVAEVAVGVGLDGGGCGEDESLGLRVVAAGGLDDGLDDADDGDGDCVDDLGHGEGCGGVAGDDQALGTVVLEEAGAFDGVAGDGELGFGAVGEAGGVAEVDVVGSRDERKELAEDG